MLVARRDPPFHSGAHDAAHPPGPHHAYGPHPPRLMAGLQIVGSLLAIPVGLVSAYSIYHANFSTEAQCQSLRANIVSMLDKSADASTLRILVRRDVLAFESSCGTVDPDAVAAFKKLLTAKVAVPAATGAPPAPPQEAKHESAPAREAAKPAATMAPPVAAEAKPVKREVASSDANWVAAVREALVHSPQDDPAPADAPVTAPPAAQARPQPHVVPAAPPLQLIAPALPAPVAVVAAPSQPPAADHPVPPGSIPDPAPAEKPSQKSSHSWLAKVPLLNRVVGE